MKNLSYLIAALLFLTLGSWYPAKTQLKTNVTYSPALPSPKFSPLDLPQLSNEPASGVEEEEHEDLLSDIPPAELQRLKSLELSPRVDENTTIDRSAGQVPQFKSLAPALGTNFGAINWTGSYPPDPTMAAGPNHLFAFVNSRVVAYSKSGVQLSNNSFFGWWSNVSPPGGPFDPRVLYDPVGHRWIMVTVADNGSTQSSFLISVSSTDNPVGTWTNYNLDATNGTGTWADFPCIGMDSVALYLGSNHFTFGSSPSFGFTSVRIVRKDSLYAGHALPYTDVFPPSFTQQPAMMMSYASAPYLLSKSTSSGNTIIVGRITNPLTAPVYSVQANVSVRGFVMAPDAVQPGTTTRLNSGDGRIGSTVIYKDGFLYLVFSEAVNFGSGTVSAMRYVKINTSTNTAVVDETFGADGYFYFYPSVAVDDFSNVYFTFSRSSASEYAGTHFTGRNVVNAQTQSSTLLKAGTATYIRLDGSSPARNRWGDYTGCVIDPSDNKTAWFIGEYVLNASNQWGTWIGSTTFARNSVSGLVLHDADANAATTTDRHYVPGWKVYLSQSGIKIDSTLTDSSGQYVFDTLSSGTYQISADIPAGDSPVDVVPGSGTGTETRLSSTKIQVTLSTAQSSVNNNLLVFVNRAVSGIVFEDVNQDSVYQVSEPGLLAWRVRISRNGSPWDSALTNGSGLYRFTGLVNGTYTISEVSPNVWFQTKPSPPGTYSVTVDTTIDSSGLNFGNFHFATISGTKFHDLNDNAQKDPNEPGLPGWKIYLGGEESDSVITDAQGNYQFSSLAYGTYSVSEHPKANWRQTLPPSSGFYTVIIDSSGKVVPGQDFGNFSLHTITGTKFHDLNGDGNFDGGEPGVAGWTIYAAGPVNDTAVTDAQGNYILGGLSSGAYTVHEGSRIGWVQTEPTTPGTYPVTFTSNESTAAGKDFGNLRLAVITGAKYEDVNGNGARDQSEPAVSGWKIYLYDNSVLEDSTLTDGNGFYSFPGLFAGNYSVCEQSIPNWSLTSLPNCYSLTIGGGDSVGGKDFGNFHLGSISGHVYEDRGTIGTNDGDPTVLIPWSVILEPPSAPPETTLTDANGAYTFNHLPFGTYTVRQILQGGWTDTYRSGTPHVAEIRSGVDTAGLDFGNFYNVSSQLYRTATQEEWARGGNFAFAVANSAKRKADKVFFKFNLVAPGPLSLTLSFSMVTSGKIYRGKNELLVDSIHGWSSLKVVGPVMLPGLHYNDTIQIVGQGVSGRRIKLKYQWGVLKAVPFPDTSFKQNFTGLPMPNLHNVGEELFPKGYHQTFFPFAGGLLVGIPQGDKKPHTVLLKKYTDVKRSLYDRIFSIHTHPERCLDIYDARGDSIKRQATSLSAAKHNNRLFAELVALKLNIAASLVQKFPPGLGELIYFDRTDNSNLFNKMSVDSIVTVADSFITCLPVKIRNTALTTGEVYEVVRRITSAFSGPMDTVSFSTKFVAKGVRPLYQVPYLQFDSSAVIQPVTLESGNTSPVPMAFALRQNYPNPFNPSTNIDFDLPEPAFVTLKLYNILGQEVATLLDRQQMDEGTQEVQFDASNFASGLYFYRLVAEGFNEDGRTQTYQSVKKMMLVK